MAGRDQFVLAFLFSCSLFLMGLDAVVRGKQVRAALAVMVVAGLLAAYGFAVIWGWN